jgi:hypothetical protein
MKWTLLLVTAIIIISVSTSITLLFQYHQTAKAFPCIGDHVKEYCIGYHDGAVQAHRDFKTGQDLDIDQRRCTHNNTTYCNGYNRGYSDEADFLG